MGASYMYGRREYLIGLNFLALHIRDLSRRSLMRSWSCIQYTVQPAMQFLILILLGLALLSIESNGDNS